MKFTLYNSSFYDVFFIVLLVLAVVTIGFTVRMPARGEMPLTAIDITEDPNYTNFGFIESEPDYNPSITIGSYPASIEITFDANGLHVADPHNAMDEAARMFFVVTLKPLVDAYIKDHIAERAPDGTQKEN